MQVLIPTSLPFHIKELTMSGTLADQIYFAWKSVRGSGVLACRWSSDSPWAVEVSSPAGGLEDHQAERRLKLFVLYAAGSAFSRLFGDCSQWLLENQIKGREIKT